MTGDPADGGRVDQISDVTGMAFGRPWTKGAQGEIYFVGARGGIYRMTVGQKPERLSSAKIEEKVNAINLDTSLIRCIYDDHTQGVHFFVTPLTAGTTTHLFYDIRHDAFWLDKFADNNMNPISVHTIEGDAPADRKVVLGATDSYIRYVDYDGKADDTSAIESYIFLGPYQLEEQRAIILKELLATLDEDSDPVCYTAYTADSAQNAFERSLDQFNGVWQPGRNWSDDRRCSGRAIYLKVGNEQDRQTWAWDIGFAHFQRAGISELRGKY
jgi:hypothetical protein